jgi:hypothetical protein
MHIFPTHKQRKSFSTYPHETIGGALVALKKRKEKKRKEKKSKSQAQSDVDLQNPTGSLLFSTLHLGEII